MHIMKFRRLLDIIVAYKVSIKSIFRANNCILDSTLLNDLDICRWVLSLKAAPVSMLTIYHVHPSSIKMSTALRKKRFLSHLFGHFCSLATQKGMGVETGKVGKVIGGIISPFYFFLPQEFLSS